VRGDRLSSRSSKPRRSGPVGALSVRKRRRGGRARRRAVFGRFSRRARSTGSSISSAVHPTVPSSALEALLEDGKMQLLAMFDSPTARRSLLRRDDLSHAFARSRDPIEIAQLVGTGVAERSVRRRPGAARCASRPGVDAARDSIALLETGGAHDRRHCAKALRFAAGTSLEELVLARARDRVSRPLLEALRGDDAPIGATGRLPRRRGVDESADRAIRHRSRVRSHPAGDHAFTRRGTLSGFSSPVARARNSFEQALRAAYARIEVRIRDAPELARPRWRREQRAVLSTYDALPAANGR